MAIAICFPFWHSFGLFTARTVPIPTYSIRIEHCVSLAKKKKKMTHFGMRGNKHTRINHQASTQSNSDICFTFTPLFNAFIGFFSIINAFMITTLKTKNWRKFFTNLFHVTVSVIHRLFLVSTSFLNNNKKTVSTWLCKNVSNEMW